MELHTQYLEETPLHNAVSIQLHSDLTNQEKAFVYNFITTHSVPSAAGVAGLTPTQAQKWLETRKIQEAIKIYDEATLSSIRVTRDHLTNMLFDAHRHSATATEEITAIREIGKMNGLYEPEKIQTQNVTYHKVEQLEQLSDEELMAMAGEDDIDLLPSTQQQAHD